MIIKRYLRGYGPHGVAILVECLTDNRNQHLLTLNLLCNLMEAQGLVVLIIFLIVKQYFNLKIVTMN